MNSIKYFIQFLIIIFFFILFKLIGMKFSSIISSKIFSILGPFFRSKKVIKNNIKKAIPNLNKKDLNDLINEMWANYGRILSEYVFIKNFRISKFHNNLQIEGNDILDKIKKEKKPVIFISGHFNNFELMAMEIEKAALI